jgi:hypothetical protein
MVSQWHRLRLWCNYITGTNGGKFGAGIVSGVLCNFSLQNVRMHNIMARTIDTKTRSLVAGWFIAQIENTDPNHRQRILRLVIKGLPRQAIDGLFIAMAMSSDSKNNMVESEQGI